MTVSVKIRVESNEPGPANYQVQAKLGSGRDAFWQSQEVGTIGPGSEITIPLYPSRRIVLSE